MADILIRGMEMPKSCMNCIFCGFAGADCELDTCLITGNAQKHVPYSKMPDCPLVLIPPHGRLIDADVLLAKENQHHEYFSDEWYVEVRTIENAPTVIPADKDGEGND